MRMRGTLLIHPQHREVRWRSLKTAGATPRRASPQGSARTTAALRDSRRDPAPG